MGTLGVVLLIAANIYAGIAWAAWLCRNRHRGTEADLGDLLGEAQPDDPGLLTHPR